MSRKTPQPTNINPMVIHSSAGTEHARDIFANPVEHDPFPGPSVDLRQRAETLDNVLGLLGKISQRSGFQMAVETPHRRDIERRYGNADAMAARVGDRKERLHENAKWHFARAFGRFALTDSGFVSKEEAKSSAAEDYEEFKSEYADSHNRAKRDEYRKKVQRAQKIREGKSVRSRRSKAS